LDGLCPTLVLNAEYDHLRPSGEAFTAAAALAGVDVRQVTIRGMLHGFLNLPSEVGPVRHCLDLIAETVIRGGLWRTGWPSRRSGRPRWRRPLRCRGARPPARPGRD